MRLLKLSRSQIEGFIILLIAFVGFFAFQYVQGLATENVREEHGSIDSEELKESNSLLSKETPSFDSYEVDAEKALNLLAGYTSPDKLVWSVTTTLISGEDSLVLDALLLKEYDDFTITVFEGPNLTKTVTKVMDEVTVELTNSGSYSGVYTDKHRPEAVMGMADIDIVAALLPEDIKKASMEILNSYEVLYVEYELADFGYTEKYWISLDFGLPLRVETYDGDALVYMAVTNEIVDRTES